MASHYLIIDFEATCANDGSVPRQEMEIIEIGAVIIDAKNLTYCDQFQSFVKPQRHPQLTPFCSQLTSIQQCDVIHAPAFGQMLQQLQAWLSTWPDYLFCSWGNYDKHQLQQDCLFHQIPYPLHDEHFNIKQGFAQQQQLTPAVELAAAMRKVGLPLTGTLHRGIDDALNMAKLMPYIVDGQAAPSSS